MTAAVIKFPVKLCAICGRRATGSMDLFDEYGRGLGQKHYCADYPYCADPDLIEDLPLMNASEG